MNRSQFILFLLILSSCGEGIKATPEPSQKAQAGQRGPFPQGIRILNGSAFPEFSFDSLKRGFDSFQLRISMVGGLYHRANVYVLKRSGNEWVGQRADLELEEKFGNGDSTHAYLSGPWPFTIRKVYNFVPPLGWAEFISRLEPNKLKDLPDMSKLVAPLLGATDGTTYYLEIATQRSYHFCAYHDVYKYEKDHPGVKYVARLVQAFEDASNPD